MVAFLLAHGADVNATNAYGQCSLHVAVANSRKDVAAVLLGGGASVNVYDRRGWTPLHLAAFMGDVELAGVLLQNKADINADRNDGRYTPLHCAASRRRKEMMEFLKEREANPLKKDARGRTAADIVDGKETFENGFGH
jgi:ankyrin repeat protein